MLNSQSTELSVEQKQRHRGGGFDRELSTCCLSSGAFVVIFLFLGSPPRYFTSSFISGTVCIALCPYSAASRSPAFGPPKELKLFPSGSTRILILRPLFFIEYRKASSCFGSFHWPVVTSKG